jgi:hypothetical protein
MEFIIINHALDDQEVGQEAETIELEIGEGVDLIQEGGERDTRDLDLLLTEEAEGEEGHQVETEDTEEGTNILRREGLMSEEYN